MLLGHIFQQQIDWTAAISLEAILTNFINKTDSETDHLTLLLFIIFGPDSYQIDQIVPVHGLLAEHFDPFLLINFHTSERSLFVFIIIDCLLTTVELVFH